ncbi:MAG: 50S ribosomal protein L10 [Candidatus Magasanikbacteria bacterium GW2011_GWA2_56_11]|uniref:Large ribosomal subunit protein uL10 n=1 Tax=Candidatus Magasanikbacteria bacterium GW2011_GWA2_56_11 TaxID=1619044 RepID=A0A0G2BBQ7_9BACT|nr:MAG: 50S ribosomal protein L10 [Candidatus Magasanikbacteria bacterium GW2011_GWA2_56_11]
MAKTKQVKADALTDLAAHIKESKSVVFANFQGLKVKESEDLRGKCREENVYYVATKKTLLNKALRDAGLEIDIKGFQGGIAAIFGLQDEVAPAQITARFAKTHEVVGIFGGVLEGRFIDAAKVKALAELPSKQQLLGQLVGTLNAPISGFVNVLAGNIRGLVTALNAIKEQKA